MKEGEGARRVLAVEHAVQHVVLALKPESSYPVSIRNRILTIRFHATIRFQVAIEFLLLLYYSQA